MMSVNWPNSQKIHFTAVCSYIVMFESKLFTLYCNLYSFFFLKSKPFVLFICVIIDIYNCIFLSVDQAAEESEETEDQAVPTGKVFAIRIQVTSSPKQWCKTGLFNYVVQVAIFSES